MTEPYRSAADYHAAGLAPPRSSHRFSQSPGCGCYWCSPHPCNLCGLAHVQPSVVQGCLDHALAARHSTANDHSEVPV